MSDIFFLWWILAGMRNYQYIIFCTLLQLTLGVHVTILKGQTVMFPLPELPPGASINSIEWKYHTVDETILLAKINLINQQETKLFSRRTDMRIMKNGTLSTEDVKDEDSGNYSCTIISQDQRMWIEQIYLQVLHEDSTTESNSKIYSTTFASSEPNVTETALIAIPVCSALAILLIVATFFIFKCRKKCCNTSAEPIYVNRISHNSRK